MRVQAHVDQWHTCRQIEANSLVQSEPIKSWAIVHRFYAAVHLIQAYLLTKNVRFRADNHIERGKAIRESTELKKNFRDAYRTLKDTSEDVRYTAGYKPSSEDYVNTASALSTVESVLTSKLKTAGANFPAPAASPAPQAAPPPVISMVAKAPEEI